MEVWAEDRVVRGSEACTAFSKEQQQMLVISSSAGELQNNFAGGGKLPILRFRVPEIASSEMMAKKAKTAL